MARRRVPPASRSLATSAHMVLVLAPALDGASGGRANDEAEDGDCADDTLQLIMDAAKKVQEYSTKCRNIGGLCAQLGLDEDRAFTCVAIAILIFSAANHFLVGHPMLGSPIGRPHSLKNVTSPLAG